MTPTCKKALEAVLRYPRWLSIGSIENVAELCVDRKRYKDARDALASPCPCEERVQISSASAARIQEALTHAASGARERRSFRTAEMYERALGTITLARDRTDGDS